MYSYTLGAAFVSYWVIGLPVGYMVGTFTSLGALGYWIGLIAGLAAGAVLLHVLFLRITFLQFCQPEKQPNCSGGESRY